MLILSLQSAHLSVSRLSLLTGERKERRGGGLKCHIPSHLLPIFTGSFIPVCPNHLNLLLRQTALIPLSHVVSLFHQVVPNIQLPATQLSPFRVFFHFPLRDAPRQSGGSLPLRLKRKNHKDTFSFSSLNCQFRH